MMALNNWISARQVKELLYFMSGLPLTSEEFALSLSAFLSVSQTKDKHILKK